MIGLEGAAELLRAGLAARVPAKLTQLETRLALPVGTLPAPRLITANEVDRLGLEDWPALLVIGLRTLPGMTPVDTTPAGATVYAVRYALRVYEWARGDTRSETDLARKRLALAVREVLVERLALDPELGYVDVGTVEESYSDVAVDDAGATIAGAYTALELVVTESADAPPPPGTVNLVDVDTASLPPHPALD